MLGPIANRLATRAQLQIWFTSEYPEWIEPLVPRGSFVTREQAEWRRFSLYFNADPWAAARLRRCQHRINSSTVCREGTTSIDQPDCRWDSTAMIAWPSSIGTG